MQPLGALCVNSYSAHPLLQTRKVQNTSKPESNVEEIAKKEKLVDGDEEKEQTQEKNTCHVFVEKCTYSLPPSTWNDEIVHLEECTASSANASSQVERSLSIFNKDDENYNDKSTAVKTEEVPKDDYVALRLYVCNALVAKYKTIWEQYHTLLTSLQETYKALEEKCQNYKLEALLTRRKTQALMSKRRARDELITLVAMERQEMMRFSVLRDKREKRQALCDQLELLLHINNCNNNEKERKEADTYENSEQLLISYDKKEEEPKEVNDIPRLSQHSLNTLNDFLTDLAKEENDLTIICIQRPVFTSRKCTTTTTISKTQDNELSQRKEHNNSLISASASASLESSSKERKGYFTFFGGATLEHLSAKPYATFVSNMYRLARAARENEWHLQLLISELREDAANVYSYSSTENEVNRVSTCITNEQIHERCSNSSIIKSKNNELELHCQGNKSAEVNLSDEKLFLQFIKDDRGNSYDDEDKDNDDDSLFLISRSKKTAAKANKQEIHASTMVCKEKQENDKQFQLLYQEKEAKKEKINTVVASEMCCVRYAEPLLSTISANLSNEEREIQETYSTEIERQREERRRVVHEMKEKFWNAQRGTLKNAICTLTNQQHELIASLRDSGVQQIHVQWVEPCNAESCILPKKSNKCDSIGVLEQSEKRQSVCSANSPAMQLFEPASVETECNECLLWNNTSSMTFMQTPKKMIDNENKDQIDFTKSSNHIYKEVPLTNDVEVMTSQQQTWSGVALHSHEHHLTVRINENYIIRNNDKVEQEKEEEEEQGKYKLIHHNHQKNGKSSTRINDEHNTTVSSRRTRFSSRSTISTSTISTTSMRSTNLPLEYEEEELELEEVVEPEMKSESNHNKKKESNKTANWMTTNVENMKSMFRNTFDRFSMRATQLNDLTRTSSELCSAIPLCRMKEQPKTQNNEAIENTNVKSSLAHTRRRQQTVQNIITTNITACGTSTTDNIKYKIREKESKSYYIQLETNANTVAKNNNNNNNNTIKSNDELFNFCHYNRTAIPIDGATTMANASITYNGPAAYQRKRCKLQNEEKAKEVWRLREELARIEESNFVQEHHLQSLEKTLVEQQERRKERLCEAEIKLAEQESLVESFKHEQKKWICILHSYQRKLKRRNANEHQHEHILSTKAKQI